METPGSKLPAILYLAPKRWLGWVCCCCSISCLHSDRPLRCSYRWSSPSRASFGPSNSRNSSNNSISPFLAFRAPRFSAVTTRCKACTRLKPLQGRAEGLGALPKASQSKQGVQIRALHSKGKTPFNFWPFSSSFGASSVLL